MYYFILISRDSSCYSLLGMLVSYLILSFIFGLYLLHINQEYKIQHNIFICVIAYFLTIIIPLYFIYKNLFI